MAIITSNVQFDIADVDLNWYARNEIDSDVLIGANAMFNGITYPDVVYVEAQQGGEHNELDLGGYGLTVDANGAVTGGHITGFYETDVDTGAIYFTVEGVDVSAADAFAAYLTEDNADEIALLNGALAGSDTFVLSAFDDRAFALGGDDVMLGYGGDDYLDGGAGADLIYGDDGDDTLIGGDGDDYIIGGAGDDVIDGGAGLDAVRVDAGGSAATVSLAMDGGAIVALVDGVATDRITNAEFLLLGDLAAVSGGQHVDVSGFDAAAAGVQIEFVDSAGDDSFVGTAGADIFAAYGPPEDGVGLSGGTDVLTGGGGADIYDFTFAVDALGGTTITDFGTDDLIDLSYNDPANGPGYFLIDSFIGSAAFSGQAGEYRSVAQDGKTYVEVDTDGDGAADGTLTIANGEFTLEEVSGRGLSQGDHQLVIAGSGGGEVNTITGTEDFDSLTGTAGDDAIAALGGNDTIFASQGHDTVDGGDGVDRLVVDLTDETVFDPANGAREITITGSAITDGGALDTALSAVDAITLVDDSAAGMVIDASGWAPAETYAFSYYYLSVRLGDGDNHVTGSDSGDFVGVGGGTNVIDTGGGEDGVEIRAGAGEMVTIGRAGGALLVFENGVQIDSVTGAEQVRIGEAGAAEGQHIDASGLDRAGLGVDLLLLMDGSGDDTLLGSDGADVFVNTSSGYSTGTDVYTGNGGADIYDFSVAADALGGTTITDFDDDDLIDLSYNDPVVGADDLVSAFIGTDAFSGTAGEYRYYTDAGKTYVQYDSDGDGSADGTLTIANGAFTLAELTQDRGAFTYDEGYSHALVIAAPEPTITGTAGADDLSGTTGDDVIAGGGGADMLTGGGGADRFVFDEGGVDGATITDLGLDDVIDLDGTGSGAAASFIGAQAFSGTAGEVRSVSDGSATYVEVDADGDGAADGVLTLANGPFKLESNAAGELTLAHESFFQALGDGAASEVAGFGRVIGTTGVQDVTVRAQPGEVTFDGSFNHGGDRIHLAGDAGDYTALRDGSRIVVSNGETSVIVPVGAHGADLVFDDGTRTITASAAGVMLGDQTITATAAPITAAAQTPSATGAIDPDAGGQVVMAVDGVATFGGNATVFGTQDGHETAVILGGHVRFDGSFNQGGDTIALEGTATGYEAARDGSLLVLTMGDDRIEIPVGRAATTVSFDGDARDLFYDAEAGTIMLGDQAIGTDAEPLDGAAAAFVAPTEHGDALLAVMAHVIDPLVMPLEPGVIAI